MWTTRIIGIAALVSVAFTVWLALWVTPPDVVQGNLVRLVYLHPAVAWVALYLAFGLAAVASLLYLWPRTRSLFWDRLAAAAVEVGVVFNVCTLISGSIWGRPTWGVYWTWDARLTSTALLLILFLGYMALRRVPADPEVRAKRCAFAALFAAVDVPIVHFSVLWWKTLHQGATVLNPDLSPQIHGSMAWTLLLGFVALTLVFFWMLLVRYRIGSLQDQRYRHPSASGRGSRQRPGQLRDAGHPGVRCLLGGSHPGGAAGHRGWAGIGGRADQGGAQVNYVIAGYSIVLGLLFLYAVQLIWRRRRLNRLVALALSEADAADAAADQRAQDGP
jgi:heme exporter protein C